MTMLTRESISAKKSPPEKVTLKETQDTAFIRHMSGLERMRVVQSVTDSGQLDAVTAVLYFLGNEDGTRMFADKDKRLVETMDGLLFQDIFMAGLEVNGLADFSESDAEKN